MRVERWGNGDFNTECTEDTEYRENKRIVEWYAHGGAGLGAGDF